MKVYASPLMQCATIPISGTGVGNYVYPVTTSYSFGTTEPTLLDSLPFRIRIAGNQTFTGYTTVDSPPFYWGNSIPTSVNAGDTLRGYVYFYPETQGTFSGQLQFISNAINEDTLRFTATGSSSYVPATPGNLTIVRSVNDINLNWSRVDTSVGGVPLTVTYYLVFFKNLFTDSWAFLALTNGTGATAYVHPNAARFSNSMYYQVRAYVGTAASADKLRRIPQGATLEEVHRLLN